jgi:hypothetical protein
MVCVIPGGAACKPDIFNKLLNSLLKVNEIDIINAALSGDLDLSILKSPCGKYSILVIYLHSPNPFIFSSHEEPTF